MSAIKKYLELCESLIKYAEEGDYQRLLSFAGYEEIKEISDRLDSAEAWHKTVNEVLQTHKEFALLQSKRIDALEQQAHSHAVSQSMTISDERSCENIEVPPVSVVTGEYWPFLGGEQPRADQVGTPISCAEAIKKSREVLHKAEDERKRFAEEEAERNKCSECDDLRARLAEAERIARENGELALERKVKIERLEKEQSDILFLIQTRLQPPGSPCPGGPVMLATWITGEAVKNIERLEKENAELKRKLEGGK